MPAAASLPSSSLAAPNVIEWLNSFRRSEFRRHSQNGEDGVLQHIFQLANASDRYYVEFGVENGMECNTRWLREHGWTGLLMDGQVENLAINLHRELIDESSIVPLLHKHGVPPRFDLLSVDVDCKDWWLTRRILHAGFRPQVIVNEVNTLPFLAPPVAKTVARNQTERYCTQPFMTSYQGASLSAFSGLYKAYGYRMVYCESRGVNCFGMREDLLNLFVGDNNAEAVADALSDAKLYRPPRFGFRQRGHPPDPLKRPWTNVSAARAIADNGGVGDDVDTAPPEQQHMRATDLHFAGMRTANRAGR